MNGDPVPSSAVVPVTSAWASKINWTQAVAVGSSILVFAFGPKASLSTDQQLALVTTINLVQSAATWIFRTWYNGSVSPSSLPK